MNRLFERARCSACRVAPWLLLAALATPARAQTDFMNTDRGRPLTVEDAIAIERWGVELQVAPLRLERLGRGSYQWGLEPAITLGLLPRTEFELGLPLAMIDATGVRITALAGVDLAVMHQLNVESDALPAMAVRAEVLLPGGGLGPDRAYTSLVGLVTRSLTGGVRLHANAGITAGAAASAGAGVAGPGARDLSRWMAGVAIDRTWALSSTLVGLDATVREPLGQPGAREWSVGVGTRIQLDPRWLMDVGIGRRGGANSEAWYATVGGAFALGWRFGGLMGGN